MSSAIRFAVQPRLVPAAKAARRLHLLPHEFAAKLGELLRHGFPPPEPATGHFDLAAIDAWLDRLAGLGGRDVSTDARSLISARLRAFDG